MSINAQVITFWHEDEENGYLSNWYASPFELCGRRFASAEHYLMWQKARVFGDAQMSDAILAALTPPEAKALGKKVTPFDATLWDAVSEQLMVYGVRQKFVQEPTLRQALLATAPSLLVEASPYDSIWGVGLPASDPRVTDPSRWKGKNLQGRVLMRVRSELGVISGLLDQAWSDERIDDLLESPVGKMSLLELSHIPAARAAARTYGYIARFHLGKAHQPLSAFLASMDAPLTEVDDAVDYGSGGTLPLAGWRETLFELRLIAQCGM